MNVLEGNPRRGKRLQGMRDGTMDDVSGEEDGKVSDSANRENVNRVGTGEVDQLE